MSDEPWVWDPSLYAGSAAYYARGRVAYPQALADQLADELGLDGTGRLLDVGCGPGSLTLLMAGLFEEVVGVDADRDMLAAARRTARATGTTNAAWVHLRAERLPAGLGRFHVVTLAQSFHWMNRPLVAALPRSMLEPGGAVVHVAATTHQGVDGDTPLPHPRPPWPQIELLVQDYLGPIRRAGRGTLAGPVIDGGGAAYEAEAFRAAGLTGPTRREVPGRVVVRTTEEVVASVFSLSYAAPHLFGDRRPAFEAGLRSLLASAAPGGVFSEELREIRLDVWRGAA